MIETAKWDKAGAAYSLFLRILYNSNIIYQPTAGKKIAHNLEADSRTKQETGAYTRYVSMYVASENNTGNVLHYGLTTFASTQKFINVNEACNFNDAEPESLSARQPVI